MKQLIRYILMMIYILLIVGCTPALPETTPELPAPGNEDAKEAIVVGDQVGQSQTSKAETIGSNTQEFRITAKQWSFEPSVITVSEGDAVKLSVSSVDVTHGLRLAEFGISEILKPGKTVDIEFIANKKGTFSFFCTVQCGSGHGSMRGTLIVK